MQRLAWRSDSCSECRGPEGEDLSGGYYEAGGSYLKFTFPTAYTITQLSWGVVEYRDGFEKVGELAEALQTIKWGTDYLLACHSSPSKIVAMFGSSEVRKTGPHITLVTFKLGRHNMPFDCCGRSILATSAHQRSTIFGRAKIPGRLPM